MASGPVTTSSSIAPRVLDPWGLVELIRYGRGRGEPALRRLIASFLDEAQARAAALDDAATQADFAGAIGNAHALRGASLCLAAAALADCCARIEKSSGRQDLEAVRGGVAELGLHLSQTRSALERALFGPAGSDTEAEQ